MDEGVESGGSTRDRVIATLYETALRPSGYDEFVDAWSCHLEASLANVSDLRTLAADGPADLMDDPELEAHFKRVVALLDALGRERANLTLADYTASRKGFALLVDASGATLAASRSSRIALDGDGDDGEADLVARLRGRLVAESAALLDRALQDLASGGARECVLLGGDDPRHLLAKPFRLDRDVEGAEETTRWALLVEALDIVWTRDVADTLATSFRLSASEVAVAKGLAGGQSIRNLSEATGKSQHTVRNQLKAVLAKTGTGGQADLMRLLALLAGSADIQAAPTIANLREPALLDLPDGRTMEVHSRGRPGGRPVIFIHGMLDGTAVTGRIERSLRARGLEFICPVRPSFGRSSAGGHPTDAPRRFADDAAWLMDRLGLDRPVLVGHMSGSLYAYALAGLVGERVAGIVNVSGGVPIVSRRQFAEMSTRQRAVAYTARYAPSLLRTVIDAGISQINGREVDLFMDALYGTHHDRDVIRNHDLAALIQEGYRFAVAQGATAFATDSRHVVRDWSELVMRCARPVIHVHGRFDPVVSARSVAAFAERHPHVRADIHEAAGQLVFYEHPDFVLDAVERTMGQDRSQPLAEAISA